MSEAMRLRAAAVITAVVLAVTVSGCSSDSGGTASSSGTTSSATTSTSGTSTGTTSSVESTSSSSASESTSPSATAETSASSADSSGAPAGSATPEGTKLAYGESAVVVLDDEKPGELVQLTVNAPRAGTPEELASLQVQGLKGDEAIYYLDLAITNVSAAPTGGDYNPSTTSQLLALQPDQSPATPVIKFSTFDPCENELPADLAVGGSFQTCEIVVTSGGQPIEHVQFVATLTSDPIIWS